MLEKISNQKNQPDKVEETCKAGSSYEKVSQMLNISWCGSITQLKEYGTNLTRHDHPPQESS